ncbi:hypothetical protein ACH5RR_001269 [Cinchona calisaya]|uniref:Uncharacterized protein n=1 Tax=Cinchona calisaya TaxID=153742 RepID=A0ABD3B3R1_9GENT
MEFVKLVFEPVDAAQLSPGIPCGSVDAANLVLEFHVDLPLDQLEADNKELRKVGVRFSELQVLMSKSYGLALPWNWRSEFDNEV